MKAIETHYAGHRFRSRLEARWAVFFEHVGLAWQYEPQGFEVGPRRRRYLPDFYLPHSSTWVEVKPVDDHLDMDLIRDCVGANGLPGVSGSAHTTRGLLILGQIPRHEFLDLGSRVIHPVAQSDESGLSALGFLSFRAGAVRAEEWVVTTENSPLSKRGGELVNGRIVAMVSATPADNTMYRIGDETVNKAYAAAREARFEYGETPFPGGRT